MMVASRSSEAPKLVLSLGNAWQDNLKMQVLKTENLVKSFRGRCVVNKVSLAIQQGDLADLALVGQRGPRHERRGQERARDRQRCTDTRARPSRRPQTVVEGRHPSTLS